MSQITYVTGDATDPVGAGTKIIAHVCNDYGGWGAGFVKAVSRRWPEPEASYRNHYRTYGLDLGDVQYIPVADSLWVANMVAQHGYGIREPAIRYGTLRECLYRLGTFALHRGASVHMPRIGCGLAGGQWSEVEPIIQDELCARDIPVTVYDLP